MRLPESVPPLRGWPWRVFVGIWTLSLVAALATTVMAFVTFQPWQTSSPGINAGLVLSLRSNNSVTVVLAVGDEAERSGGTLVSIDGRPVSAASRSTLDVQLAGPDGSALTVETRSPTGKRSLHRLTRDSNRYRQATASAGLTPAVIASLHILFVYVAELFLPLVGGVILLVRRAREPLAPWVSLCMILVPLSTGPGAGWLTALGGAFSAAASLAGNAMFVLFVLTLALFPDARFTPRITWIIVPILLAMTIASNFFDSYILGNSVLLGAMMSAVALTVARYRAMAPGVGRQQIRWALFGFSGSCIALAALVLVQALLLNPETYAEYLWLQIGGWFLVPLILMLVLGGMTVSLMRYRLYDADAAISRSVALGALTLSLLAIFAGSEKLIELFGEEYFGQSLGMLAGGMGAAIAAVLITPIHHRISRWAEHRFQSALVHLRRGLPLLVADMRENASPEILSDTVLARVEKGVRAVHGAIVGVDGAIGIRDIDQRAVDAWLAAWRKPSSSGHALDVDRADPLFPVRVPLRADGIASEFWLILGPRPDGSFYGKDERETLLEIADPIARALAVATERQRREGTTQQEIGKLAAMFIALQNRLNKLDHRVERLLPR